MKNEDIIKKNKYFDLLSNENKQLLIDTANSLTKLGRETDFEHCLYCQDDIDIEFILEEIFSNKDEFNNLDIDMQQYVINVARNSIKTDIEYNDIDLNFMLKKIENNISLRECDKEKMENLINNIKQLEDKEMSLGELNDIMVNYGFDSEEDIIGEDATGMYYWHSDIENENEFDYSVLIDWGQVSVEDDYIVKIEKIEFRK